VEPDALSTAEDEPMNCHRVACSRRVQLPRASRSVLIGRSAGGEFRYAVAVFVGADGTEKALFCHLLPDRRRKPRESVAVVVARGRKSMSARSSLIAAARTSARSSGLDRRQGRPLTTVPEWVALVAALDPAEDAVEVRATHRALGLGHPGALVVDVHLA
jgi:hypothetical protein